MHRLEFSWRWWGVAVLVALLLPVAWARAEEPPPRVITRQVTETQYTWWVVPWHDSHEPVCQVEVYHPDYPTPPEIYRACGWDVYYAWAETPPCPQALEGGDVSACEGYYLFYVGAEEVTHTVEQHFPPPTAQISLEGCVPDLPHYRCPQPVRLRVQGVEFFPEAHIANVRVQVPQGVTVACYGDQCLLTLPESEKARQITVRFWATSSLGDSTPHYTAKVRWAPDEEQGGAVVDVIAPQWADPGGDACEQVGRLFPPMEDLPAWAHTPPQPEDLATDVPYALLAGRLIAHGIVQAEDCPGGGLQGEAANPCGMARAREVVHAWQNHYDRAIWDAARQAGIPAVLFKRLIAHESQFWPALYPDRYEVGFGQLSPQGIDTLLLWDPASFQEVCQDTLMPSTCARGYASLTEPLRMLLYGAVWVRADLTCPDCPTGVDDTRARESLGMFARLLRAHCCQTWQLLDNITTARERRTLTQVDLWRFTLANYNGPDCLYQALQRALEEDQPLVWDAVKDYFSPQCMGVVHYVETLAP